jgi:hypothetical protein
MNVALLPRTLVFGICLVVSTVSAAPCQLRVVGPASKMAGSSLVWHGWLLVRSDAERAERVTPQVEVDGARVLDVFPASAEAAAERSALFAITLAIDGTTPGQLRVTLREYPKLHAICPLRPVIDLSQLDWEQWWAGAKSTLSGLREPPQAAVPWKPLRLPKLWQELGVTWVRSRVRLPAAWRGRTLQLDIAAVDDCDATFFNGRAIGKTDGWDTPRKYRIPADMVRWDQANEICIAVDNVNAGGGIYRLPLELRPADVPASVSADSILSESVAQDERQRSRPKPLGAPLPLRPLRVEDGILEYADGGEAALWGVNYYPQSWVEYENLKKLGGHHRRSIDEDLDDLRRIGIEILRIHVFDSEISDGAGNLVHNDHLDVLDYLVSQCNARGLYLMLTPIAWWSSPSARPDSFSQNTPKQGMSLWPAAWPAQANYLRQFLAHSNPYTKRRLVDEPCLVLFELINEPNYWSFAEITRNDPGWTAGTRVENIGPAQEGVRRAWRELVPGENWRTPQGYALFRYETLRRYINTMIAAIRGSGARQPIAYFGNPWGEVADIFEAIADCRCDAITLGAYPGGLPQDPRNDKQNLLKAIWPKSVDARFAKKARLVYEFDAAGTLNCVSMYPAIARHWRELGVQVACQFQYDPRATAHLNCDWPQHYLNVWYTPEKMVSFLIGGETFRRLARGTKFALSDDDQVFAPAAVSFRHNAAILCAEDCYMQARPADWRPLELPKAPRRIVSVGNCPYFDYSGSGMIDLRIDGDRARLWVYPDVDRLRADLQGTTDRPLARLQSRSHPFRLRLPGWESVLVRRQTDGVGTDVPSSGDEFSAIPGEYCLKRR